MGTGGRIPGWAARISSGTMENPATLLEGASAPVFTLPAEPGGDISLDALRGKPVVLYFYPKDNTPGCTREACDFRDRHERLADVAHVFGVSRDSARSHSGFRAKYNLPFALLVDAEGAVHRQYGAWGEKVLYGKASTGPLRTTVLIDAEGRVARVWHRVRVDGHAEAVTTAVLALAATAT